MAQTSAAFFQDTLTTLERQSRPVDGHSLGQARFRAQKDLEKYQCQRLRKGEVAV